MSQNENQSKKNLKQKPAKIHDKTSKLLEGQKYVSNQVTIVFKTVLIECRKIKTSIVPTTTNIMITQW